MIGHESTHRLLQRGWKEPDYLSVLLRHLCKVQELRDHGNVNVGSRRQSGRAMRAQSYGDQTEFQWRPQDTGEARTVGFLLRKAKSMKESWLKRGCACYCMLKNWRCGRCPKL